MLLKLGTYGLLRFNLSLFPEASVDAVWIMGILAVIGIIYGSQTGTMVGRQRRVRPSDLGGEEERVHGVSEVMCDAGQKCSLALSL